MRSYVEKIKHKTTINNQEERQMVVSNQKGVTQAYITENDCLPPQEILDEMQQAIDNGEKCAIFLGSDWIKKFDEKPESSLKEYEYLVTNYPQIILTSTPRPDNSLSSTNLRNELLEAREAGDNNPYEITNIGESLV